MLEEVSFATTSPAPRKAAIILLPEAILSRYPALPTDVARFLGSLAICHNSAQSVWFLTPEDYAGTPNGEGFAWNEHFPILYAVHSDYDYLAVRLTAEGFGSIVHSFAPFWEEPTVLAPDFTTFLEVFATAAQAADPSWPYSIFLAIFPGHSPSERELWRGTIASGE